MAVTERGKAARTRSATARGGGQVFSDSFGKKSRALVPLPFSQVSRRFVALSHPPTPARHHAPPSNAPDVGLGALDVEEAEGLGDDGSHS